MIAARLSPRTWLEARASQAAVVDRQQEPVAEHDVDLGRDEPRSVGQGEEHQVDDPVGRLDLGPLVALEDVLDDERMQAQRGADRLDLRARRRSTRSTQTVGRPARAQVGQGAERLVAIELPERAVRAAPPGGSGPGRRRWGRCAGRGRLARRGPWSLSERGRLGAIGREHTRLPDAVASVAAAQRPPRARDGGMATVVTTAATRNSPTMIERPRATPTPRAPRRPAGRAVDGRAARPGSRR